MGGDTARYAAYGGNYTPSPRDRPKGRTRREREIRRSKLPKMKANAKTTVMPIKGRFRSRGNRLHHRRYQAGDVLCNSCRRKSGLLEFLKQLRPVLELHLLARLDTPTAASAQQDRPLGFHQPFDVTCPFAQHIPFQREWVPVRIVGGNPAPSVVQDQSALPL